VRLAILAPVAVLVIAACGDDGASGPADAALPPDATPTQVISEMPTLRAGESVEGIMTAVHEQLNQMVVDYVFQPAGEADWYLLVRNSGLASMDVSIRIELYGDIAWRWQ
jgi:hypothetical protein